MLTVKSFTFNPFQENTYLVYNEQQQCCIIDPGCYFQNEREELKTAIEKTGLQPVMLLNTHCHLDHVFGNQFVHDNWQLDLQIHPLEQKLLELAPETGKMYQTPFEKYSGPVVFLEENNSIKLGHEEMDILFTPGHSPGSISFYHKAGNFIIGGDVLFNGSIGRTDLPGGDMDTLVASIRKQFYTLPDDTLVYSGHGPETTIGFEKKNNPFVREN